MPPRLLFASLQLSNYTIYTVQKSRTLSKIRLYSNMASKAATKRPQDFVDFLNASPTRTQKAVLHMCSSG